MRFIWLLYKGIAMDTWMVGFICSSLVTFIKSS